VAKFCPTHEGFVEVSEEQNDNASGAPNADQNQAAKGASMPPASDEAAKAASVPPASPAEVVDPVAAELEKARADVTRFRDQWLRAAADFDNFRKRARRDVEEAQRKGLEQALLEVLPVSDNLERAVQAASSANDVQSIVDGVRMVLKFFEDALNRLGVERIASVGQTFDPALHEAVQQVETASAPMGTIMGEMMPGYRLGTKLLRAAVVSVARPPAVPSVAPASTQEGTPEPTQ